jgi:hypothetical protein
MTSEMRGNGGRRWRWLWMVGGGAALFFVFCCGCLMGASLMSSGSGGNEPAAVGEVVATATEEVVESPASRTPEAMGTVEKAERPRGTVRPTNTPRPMNTVAVEVKATATPAPSRTVTAVPTETATPSRTATVTPTDTVTPSRTATAAATNTPRPTNTAVPPTLAPVPTNTAVPLPTNPPPTSPPPTSPPPPPPAGNVQILYIRYDGQVPQSESDEYVEIGNTGGTAVNLGGWHINAGDGGQDFWIDLQPGQSCRVYTNEVHPETCGFSFGRGSAVWNNGGDCGYLYDAAGVEVSRRCY